MKSQPWCPECQGIRPMIAVAAGTSGRALDIICKPVGHIVMTVERDRRLLDMSPEELDEVFDENIAEVKNGRS